MSNIGSIDVFAARLLMVSFFLPPKWQEVSVMAVSVYFVYRSFQVKQIIPRLHLALALLIAGVFFLYLFAIPVTPHQDRAWVWILCQRKASLLLLPFVFALAGPFFRKLITGELLYFVYACCVSCLAGNADFVYHYFFFKGGMHDLSHVVYREIMERFTGIHPTYMGMFLCFSICIVLKAAAFNSQRGRIVKYALVYLLLVLLLALLVKSELIALVIIFMHFAWVHRKAVYRYKWPLAGMAAAVVAACFFIPFARQRIGEVSSYFGIGKPGNTSDNSVYVRKLILDTDAGLLKANWLAGTGPGRMLRMLHERYFFYSLAHNTDVGYLDPHNEYFCEWLSFGITGIAVLLIVLALHFRRAIAAKNHLYLYLLIILFVTFFTETVLSRQEGVLFYAMFTSLFFFSPGTSQETVK